MSSTKASESEQIQADQCCQLGSFGAKYGDISDPISDLVY